MTLGTYLLGIAAALVALGVVVEMLRRRRLRERHAVYWFIAGILALVVAVFPDLLVRAADVVGVTVPTNLIFFVSIATLFLVSLQQSSELTTLEQKTRRLAEKAALQELALERLREEVMRRDEG